MWVDISIPLEKGLTVWPGDTPYVFEADARTSTGDPCNVSHISMSTHTGTHVDAPWHFEGDGKKLDEVNPEIYMGQAKVLDVTGRASISANCLGPEPLPPRLLLKSDNSQRRYDRPFEEDYVALTPDAAERLVDEGVGLIGVDYLSVAPFTDTATVHHILLRQEVMIVEGLRLAEIPEGVYEFVVLPLPLKGADGAPARAMIRIEA